MRRKLINETFTRFGNADRVSKPCQRFVSAFFIALILFSSCVQPIDFEREGVDIKLVVEGRIVQGKAPSKLTLSTSSPYGVEREEPVLFAQITLFDDQGNQESYTEDLLNPGTYWTDGEIMEGVSGRAYHIEIQLEDGTLYQSVPDTMPELFLIDQANFNLTKYRFFNEFGVEVTKDRIQVFIDTSFPMNNSGPYFRWETDEVWRLGEAEMPWDPLYTPKTCYIEEVPSPQYIPLYNGDLLNNTRIENQLVAFRNINYSFLEKHYFNIYQMSLSGKAHAYWDRVDRVTNQVGSIFDAPPATVRSNVYNIENPDEIVLGFFEAVAIDTTRFFTLPGDFREISIFEFCRPDFRVNPPQFNEKCTNCLLIPNSKLERPDYF